MEVARLVLPILAAVLVLVLAPSRALAAGTFTIKTTAVAESLGEWHIKVRIDMTRAPGMMHIPMRFTFSKEAVDERAIMTEGRRPRAPPHGADARPSNPVARRRFRRRERQGFKSTYSSSTCSDDRLLRGRGVPGGLLGPDGDWVAPQKLTLTGTTRPFTAARWIRRSRRGKKKPKSRASATAWTPDSTKPGGAGRRRLERHTSATVGDVRPWAAVAVMVPAGAFNKTDEEEAV